MFQSLSVPGAGATWLSPVRSRSQGSIRRWHQPSLYSRLPVWCHLQPRPRRGCHATVTVWPTPVPSVLVQARGSVLPVSACRHLSGTAARHPGWLPPACQVPCLSCPRRGRCPLRPRRRVRLHIRTVLRRVALSSNVHSCDPKLRTIIRESTFLSSCTELSSSTVCMVRQLRVYIHIYDICAMCL